MFLFYLLLFLAKSKEKIRRDFVNVHFDSVVLSYPKKKTVEFLGGKRVLLKSQQVLKLRIE